MTERTSDMERALHLIGEAMMAGLQIAVTHDEDSEEWIIVVHGEASAIH